MIHRKEGGKLSLISVLTSLPLHPAPPPLSSGLAKKFVWVFRNGKKPERTFCPTSISLSTPSHLPTPRHLLPRSHSACHPQMPDSAPHLLKLWSLRGYSPALPYGTYTPKPSNSDWHWQSSGPTVRSTGFPTLRPARQHKKMHPRPTLEQCSVELLALSQYCYVLNQVLCADLAT